MAFRKRLENDLVFFKAGLNFLPGLPKNSSETPSNAFESLTCIANMIQQTHVLLKTNSVSLTESLILLMKIIVICGSDVWK